MYNLKVTQTGPLFDGGVEKALADFAIEAEKDVAEVGAQLVKERLHQVLKHPTGRYESKIHVEQASSSYLVTDGGFVTGPWLEGTSSRNKRSRFKGYGTFRKVKQELQARAGEIAEAALGKFKKRMN